MTINLAPADIRKEGSAFDLPMALGLTGCMGQFFGKPLNKTMFPGELSLDGTVRSVRGVLSATLAARESRLKTIAVPHSNASEDSAAVRTRVIEARQRQHTRFTAKKIRIRRADGAKNDSQALCDFRRRRETAGECGVATGALGAALIVS